MEEVKSETTADVEIPDKIAVVEVGVPPSSL